MKFGQRIRELRKDKGLGQRALGTLVAVSFTYISKVENHQLDFGEYPSEDSIRKLANALGPTRTKCWCWPRRVPWRIRWRVLERPDAFGKLASLDDEALDAV